MPTYIYKAIDREGKTIKGEMEAVDETELTIQLAKIDYLPISISLKSEKSKVFLLRFFKRKKVKSQALVIFTRQFATIVKAAVPIVEGLNVLAEQTGDSLLRTTLKQVSADVEKGMALSQAISRHPKVFNLLYVHTVVAGESAGVLDKVLLRLSQVMEKDQTNRSNIIASLRYPIMVVIALIIALFIFSVFVIPPFAKVYTEAGIALPIPTRLMLFISRIIINYWYIYLPAAGGLFFAVRKYINTQKGRFFWDGLKFKAPLFGRLYTKITMLRFTTMLGVLYEAGLPILKNLEIVSTTVGNKVLAKEIKLVQRQVADGKGISGGILASKFFPPLVGYMVNVGEKSGALTSMLDFLNQYYELEVDNTIKNLTTMIEPILTIVLAVAVMSMALAIFLPLWNLIRLVRPGG